MQATGCRGELGSPALAALRIDLGDQSSPLRWLRDIVTRVGADAHIGPEF